MKVTEYINGLSNGAIIGIAIGVAVAAALVVVGIIALLTHMGNNGKADEIVTVGNTPNPSEDHGSIDDPVLSHEILAQHVRKRVKKSVTNPPQPKNKETSLSNEEPWFPPPDDTSIRENHAPDDTSIRKSHRKTRSPTRLGFL
jgi:hypothetical protein